MREVWWKDDVIDGGAMAAMVGNRRQPLDPAGLTSVLRP